MAAQRSFAELVGCRLPLQLAPLGGPVGTPQLAAAVSEAGGLGMIPNPSTQADVDERLELARSQTQGPLGVGFLIPFVALDAVDAAAASAQVVEFFFGDPDTDLVRRARGHGAAAGWQVGSAAEARAAVEAGCDYVVAQGTEAGGHVRARQPLDAVLAETLAVVDVPVLAAGGIGTADRVRAQLGAGASGVRIGTRFVAAEEADAHPDWVALLIAASGEDTVLTEAFGTGWPDALHRVLRSAVEAAEALEGPAGALGEGEIPRFAPVPPTRQATGEIPAMALYAGESVGAVQAVQPAAEIVAELAAGL